MLLGPKWQHPSFLEPKWQFIDLVNSNIFFFCRKNFLTKKTERSVPILVKPYTIIVRKESRVLGSNEEGCKKLKFMWTATKALHNFHFQFHKQWHFTLPLIFMTNPTTTTARVSPPRKTARVSASFSSSAGSPVHAPLKRVGTHNGSFHCDEALGCFMIRLTHKFSNAEIVRTRDPQVSLYILNIFPLFFSLFGYWENAFFLFGWWESVYISLLVSGYWENVFFVVCLMRRCVFLFILFFWGGGVVAEKIIFLYGWWKSVFFWGFCWWFFFCLIAEKLRCFLFGCWENVISFLGFSWLTSDPVRYWFVWELFHVKM